MLKNHFVVAIRSLLKNSTYTSINIFGLAIGLAAFLFIVEYVQFERSYENFHTQADNIFRVTLDLYKGSEYIDTDCETHSPLGPALKAEMPEVLDYVRIMNGDGLLDIEVGDEHFLDEGIFFCDPSVFNVFTVEVLAGNAATALTEPMQVVLTRSMAMKYFGRLDILGEQMMVDWNMYKVTAVIEDVPYNTHLKYNILLSHASLPHLFSWYSEDSWQSNNEYTYLLMAPGTDLAAFNQKLEAFVKSLGDQLEGEMLTAEYIKDIHLYSNKSFEPEPPGNARTVNFLLLISIFIVTIAWMNYINISTARALERAREVGIRKVMGSVRQQLIIQFLAESWLVNISAGVLALLMVQTFLPAFSTLTGRPLAIDFFADGSFWMLMVGMLMGGTMLSGVYPALVLSSFKPVAVLKGKFQSSVHGQRLRKVLVVAQFATTSVLLVSVVTVYLQIEHLRKADLGMNLDKTVVLRAPALSDDSLYHIGFESFKTELLRSAAVIEFSRAGAVPGLSVNELSTRSSIYRLGRENEGGSYTYYHYWVDARYVPALQLNVLAGRNFEDGAPNHDRVLVNAEAAAKLGFSSPDEAVGSQITFLTRNNGEPSTIIGVLADFYQRSPKEPIVPMIFRYGERASYYALRLPNGDPQQSLQRVREIWDNIFPGSAFYYFFLDQYYDEQYKAEVQFGYVVFLFSMLIILIACMGLFGLSSYTIIQRTKEIGIRKVLGASVMQIVSLLSWDFMRIVLVASIIAMPIAYLAMSRWLSLFAQRIELDAPIFLVPIALTLMVALVTISLQTLKTAVANPVQSLRQE